jgi:hypothetical protein
LEWPGAVRTALVGRTDPMVLLLLGRRLPNMFSFLNASTSTSRAWLTLSALEMMMIALSPPHVPPPQTKTGSFTFWRRTSSRASCGVKSSGSRSSSGTGLGERGMTRSCLSASNNNQSVVRKGERARGGGGGGAAQQQLQKLFSRGLPRVRYLKWNVATGEGSILSQSQNNCRDCTGSEGPKLETFQEGG